MMNSSSNKPGNESFSKQDILRRMEEDRERVKEYKKCIFVLNSY